MKTKNIFSILFAAVMSAVAFTSCNFVGEPLHDSNHFTDKCESTTLSGQWHGNFGMRYTYSWHGHLSTYDSYSTDIVFYPDYNGATTGWGQQVDWYTSGPYKSIQHRVSWSVRNGIVYLTYPYDHKLDCSIRNYRMDGSTFSGYFSTGTQRFTMTKMLNYYNWSIYTDIYSVSVASTFTRSAMNADSTSVDSSDQGNDDQGVIVKYTNRYAAEDSDF